ncbi:1-acyl-sn-glycerol-3-phosphate acyltransferase [Reichenbachiella carrageenanivorans]|uniref:1-acyl-sn-glycerol-3-phosphate acyltransferase n=1 Tax=Reichenbachiella carrageenanivorans TaxID=2979869 RepID=A0ABY6CVT0_9BACT|nr:lysophospholipid acyltransferase family protein [Reichenbachiella carrageenanivorans]UXX78016.1 1-acyl-sn-glycerol-3-phosphate acyltransferase [Reichenbachiella carrageenanivorans]
MNSDKVKTKPFRLIVNRLYVLYVGLVFILTFLLGTPIVLLAFLLKTDRLALLVNHYWAHIFFLLIGVPIQVVRKGKLDHQANYIFCPNHFSFLDIATMPFVPVPFKFVGKVSIVKVPLLGLVFKRFHITVDRTRLRDRYATYQKSIDALRSGFSLTVFPEGGIRASQPPQMENFKEGPFRMAIETGTALVPVTLADNWHIFPDDGQFLLKRKKCRMVIHEPIDPRGYTLDQLQDFQNDVHHIIQSELDRLNS